MAGLARCRNGVNTHRTLRVLTGADVPADPNSGAGGTVLHGAQALAALGHDVDSFWSEQLGRRIAHGNLHYLLELPRRYRSVVRTHTANRDYDVIQLSQPHAHLAAIEHRRRQRPGVFVNRSHGVELRFNEVMATWTREAEGAAGMRSAIQAWMARRLDRHWDAIARYADGILVGSTLDRDYLLDRYPLEPWRVAAIADGVAQDLLEPAPVARVGPLRRLIHVAQFSAFKAPGIVAQVANRFLARHPQVSMSWVAAAEHHGAIRALLAPEIAGRVELIGWQPLAKLRELLDAHQVFLFPSFYEGFGKAPLEAMARGLCVLCSDEGGMRDFVAHGQTGYLVAPGNVDGFCSILEKLQADPEELAAVAARAQLAARAYTWLRFGESLAGFYAELLERRQPGDTAANF